MDLRDGVTERIKIDNYIEMFGPNNTKRLMTTSVLHILSTDYADIGVLTCMAENLTSNVSLQVIGKNCKCNIFLQLSFNI